MLQVELRRIGITLHSAGMHRGLREVQAAIGHCQAASVLVGIMFL